MQIIDTTADLPAGKIFYRDAGDAGVLVVFLHAASGNSMLWEHQVPAFTAAGFRFIALDHRATARGSNSSALLDGLLAKLNLDRCHLLGTAAGGGRSMMLIPSMAVMTSSGGKFEKRRMKPDMVRPS